MGESTSSGSFFLFVRSMLLAVVLAAATLGLPFGTVSKTASTSTTVTATSTAMDEIVATSTPVVASSSVLLVASAVPGASTDKLYEVDLGAKTVKAVPVENGWRQWKLQGTTVHIEPRATGDVSLLVGGDWNVLLRDKAGNAYQEAQVLGMNKDHVMLVARKDQRMLLRVSKLGSIEELLPIQETQEIIGWKAGYVWLASFQPGEGIELAPMGPSQLTAVDVTGKAQSIFTNEEVITGVVPFSTERFAYMTDSGSFVYKSGTSSGLPGKPLFWLNQDHVVSGKGALLFDYDLTTGSSTDLVSLPTTASEAVEK